MELYRLEIVTIMKASDCAAKSTEQKEKKVSANTPKRRS